MSRYQPVAVYCIAEIISSNPLRFDHFKIGVSSNLRSRLSSLQTGNPRPLAVIIADWFRGVGDARLVERRAHEYLAAESAVGEWFSYRDGDGGCPFEAMAIAASCLPYVPASDSYYTHDESSFNPVLLATPQRYPGLARPSNRGSALQ